MTKKVIQNVWGPIFIGRSTSPITVLLEPSNSLTTNSQGFITSPSIVNFDNELFGRTFRDEPISTNALDKIMSTHFMEICRALLWFLPSDGSSSSLNPKLILEAILLTTPLNWQTEISYGTWATLKSFTKASLCASEHISKDNIEIFVGVWLSWSTTL